MQIYIERDIVPVLIRYCEENAFDQFTLVADQNTYPILGQAVENALKGRGWDVNTVVLSGSEILPNEHYLIQVLIAADTADRVYLAVGSGTITDITRFVSHRTKAPFISIPTAPSVDGYASIGAPLVVAGLKQTVLSQAPIAVFSHLPTLCDAPPAMIASGFGDILGKYTSLADWRLGHLLWAEPYSAPVAEQMRRALQNCAEHADDIASASEEGITLLMNGLIEAGRCMVAFGSSRPASGMEHHLSHHLEMKLIWEEKPAVLHGAKVGVTSLIVAGYYEKVRGLSRSQVVERLETTPRPSREAEIKQIRAVYPPIADRLIAAQAPFLTMSDQEYEALQQKIIDQWSQIQDIAATIPSPQALTTLLQKVGAATDMPTLGISNEELDLAIKNAHYLRDRFTVAKLSRMLGLL